MADQTEIGFVDIDNLTPENIETAVEAKIASMEAAGFAVQSQQMQQLDPGSKNKRTVVALVGTKDSSLTAPGVELESDTDRAAVALSGIDPNITRFYTLTVPNGGGSFTYNHVAGFGVNIQDNTAAVNPDVPAVWFGLEGSYWTGSETQAEVHFNVDYKGLRIRPFNFRSTIDIDPANRLNTIEFYGTINITTSGTVETQYAQFNQATKRLWIYEANGASIGTPGDTPVPIRGIELTSGKVLRGFSGARPALEGLEVAAGFTAQLSAYTVAGLPSASPANQVVIVTDDVAGFPLMVISDGTNWRRSYDGAITSTT